MHKINQSLNFCAQIISFGRDSFCRWGKDILPIIARIMMHIENICTKLLIGAIGFKPRIHVLKIVLTHVRQATQNDFHVWVGVFYAIVSHNSAFMTIPNCRQKSRIFVCFDVAAQAFPPFIWFVPRRNISQKIQSRFGRIRCIHR
jgi:hypothetical protein